jgi:hypothetical protein
VSKTAPVCHIALVLGVATSSKEIRTDSVLVTSSIVVYPIEKTFPVLQRIESYILSQEKNGQTTFYIRPSQVLESSRLVFIKVKSKRMQIYKKASSFISELYSVPTNG